MKTVNELKHELFANKSLHLQIGRVEFTNAEASRWLFLEPQDDSYYFEYPQINTIRIWK